MKVRSKAWMEMYFLTLDNVGSFSYQLFVVVVATEFTKRLLNKIYKLRKKENNIETEFIVFGYSVILSIIKTLSNNNLVWTKLPSIIINVLLLLMNALIISYLAIAGYSKIIENVKKDQGSSLSHYEER